ncbi:hypothetical protein H4S07_004957, partial [Coemansia furcata]
LATLALQNLDVPDALIRQAASVVTDLRTLHIRGAAQLTGESVGALLRDSTRLAALGLFNCANLSEALLDGLAQGPSAQSLRVLMVRQCAVQSDGVEAALSAFPNIKHLSIVGVEVVRQQYEYVYVADANPALETVESHGSSDIPVQRSFKPMYPSGHYFCKSDPTHEGCPDEGADSREVAGAGSTAWEYQRAMWDSDSASRFVPGLLAFASCPVASESSVGGGRRRAATISSEDHLDAGESDGASDSEGSNLQPAARRLRSNSEQPSSNLSPVAAYDENAFHTPEQSRSIDNEIVPALEQPESADPMVPEEAESAEVDQAIDRLEHVELGSAGETADADVVDVDVAESTSEIVDPEPSIVVESIDSNDVGAELVAAEQAADTQFEETRDREITADVEPHSTDIASIAGGTALALVAAGVAMSVFGSRSIDEAPESTADDTPTDESGTRAVANEPHADSVVQAAADEPAVESGIIATEQTVEAVADEPTVEPAVESVEIVADEPAVDEPAVEIAKAAVDEVAVAEDVEVVADEPAVEAVVEEPTVEAVEAVAEEPAVETAEAAVDEPATEDVEAVIHERAIESVDAVVVEIGAETAEPVAEEPAVEAAEAVVDEPAVDEPAVEAAEAIADGPAVEVVADEPTVETTEVVVEEPAIEVVNAIAEEHTIETADAVVEEPAVETAEAVADELTVGSAEVVSEEPAAEAVEVVADEPIVETSEVVAEPVLEACEAVVDESAVEVIETVVDEPVVGTTDEPAIEAVVGEPAVETVDVVSEDRGVDIAEVVTNEPAVEAA